MLESVFYASRSYSFLANIKMDEEQNHHHLPFSSSSSIASINEVPADTSLSNSASSQVQEEEEEEDNQHEAEQQVEQELHQTSSSSRVSIIHFQNDPSNDSWSCLAMIVTFWFFASMTMILGFYGPLNLRVAPNCSRLIQVNSFFISDIKAQELAGPANGLMLYSFHNPPPLDVETTWSETYNASLPAYTHQEWIFFLNQGSEIDISYSVKSQGSVLFLVIAQGKESLNEWSQNPSYPNITLSWNIIQGIGVIKKKMSTSSDYYVAVGNLYPVEVEVHLNLSIRAILYNTTEAYFKCSPAKGPCVSQISFMRTDVAVLTSSGLKQGSQSDDWYVTLSYGERWMAYILGSGAMTVLVLVVFKICVKCQSAVGDNGYDRTPLLVNKDGDVSSCGSSYSSGSNDKEDLEDSLIIDSLEGKLSKDGEKSNPRRLCVICIDAPRDCFFLPCGHCATCFTCGTRIAEEAGTCPICRRKMKKVKKIFTV